MLPFFLFAFHLYMFVHYSSSIPFVFNKDIGPSLSSASLQTYPEAVAIAQRVAIAHTVKACRNRAALENLKLSQSRSVSQSRTP